MAQPIDCPHRQFDHVCVSRHTSCDLGDDTKHDHHHPFEWYLKFALSNA